jgi:NAD-dependent DNA ligase
MPAGKPEQSSAMLYGMIVFIILFIAATVFAIMFYVKYSDFSTRLASEESARRELATSEQARNAQQLIGEADGTYLGTLLGQFNSLYKLATGKMAVDEQSTEAKLAITQELVNEMYAGVGDAQAAPDDVSLAWIASQLKTQRDEYLQRSQTLAARIEQIQKDWDNDIANFSKTEEQLLEEKAIFSSQAEAMTSQVNKIQRLAEQGAETQMSLLQGQLDERNQKITATSQQLTELEELYVKSESSRRRLEQQIESIKPRPDIELEAYKPDGYVLSVDVQRGIAYLSIGGDDKVYRGLTFTIFDKANPRPEDGKGKAEVKVFEVMSKVCAARIIQSRPDSPVIEGDIAANLIWDNEIPYNFVVTGEFDITGDGKVDYRGRETIVQLIREWGGIISDEVSVNTDFVVAGNPPRRISEPEDETADVDPLAEEKYQQTRQSYEEYKSLLEKAGDLSIPVFDTRRFMNLIGYNTEAKLSVPEM